MDRVELVAIALWVGCSRSRDDRNLTFPEDAEVVKHWTRMYGIEREQWLKQARSLISTLEDGSLR
jgi:hypothetical protein